MPSDMSLEERNEKIAWNRLIHEAFNDPQSILFAGKFFHKSYLHFVKQIISDYLIIKSFADPAIDTNNILDITIQRILKPFREKSQVTSLKNREKMIQYFELFLRETFRKCEKNMYVHTKNRVIFLIDIQDGVKSGITTLTKSIPPVAKNWGIKNYKINQNYIDSLTDWAHEYKSKKYQLLNSNKLTTRHDRISRAQLKNQEKEIQFHLKMRISIALCYVLLLAFSFQFIEYETAMVITILGSAIAAVAQYINMKAFNSAAKAHKRGLDKDFEEFADHTINLSIKKPKPENNFALEITPTVTKMADVDYSFYSTSATPQPKESFSMSKRMMRWLDHSEIKAAPLETNSPAEPDFELIDDFHIKFKYKRVTHDAFLDEQKLPEDKNEAQAIISSFKKGPMSRHGDQTPHSIVVASKSDGTLFKITTAFAGRMKSHSDYIDANTARTTFDIYDPRAHHVKRRKN